MYLEVSLSDCVHPRYDEALIALEVDEHGAPVSRLLQLRVHQLILEDVVPPDARVTNERVLQLAFPRAVEAIVLREPVGFRGLGVGTPRSACSCRAHAAELA
jgi:hypothetical protein